MLPFLQVNQTIMNDENHLHSIRYNNNNTIALRVMKKILILMYQKYGYVSLNFKYTLQLTLNIQWEPSL